MKKIFISTLTCLGLLVSNVAFAEIKVEIPDSINLLVVNSMKPKIEDNGFFGTKTLLLPNGQNQIAFKFEPSVEQNDTVRRVYSDVIIAKFNTSDTELQFELPKYRDLNEARNEIKKVEWSLVDESGKPIVLSKDILVSDGVQFGRDYRQDIIEYNQRGGIAAVQVQGTMKSLPVDAKSLDSENTAQLKMWYLKSSSQERKDFQVWLINQK